MDHTVGTCGNCGGRVTIPRDWYGVTPPIPACESCGARVRQPYGPVVPMQKPPSAAVPFADVCHETAYGSTQRLSFAVRVF